MYDYAALAAQAVEDGLTGDRIPAIKAGLPIIFVLERYGHTVEAVSGKWVTRCPFHDDAEPSFDVYGEKLERWGCYPCGKGGDVLDLIQELEGVGFADAVDLAWAMMLQVGQWDGPREGAPKATFDFEAARQYVEASELEDPTPFYSYLSLKVAGGQRAFEGVDPQEVYDDWRLGTKGDRVVIPYYDRDGVLVTYKWRTAGTKPMTAAGSKLGDVLYGEWRDHTPERTVVLTEGESDAWAAAAHLDGSYAVLSLSSGAGQKPSPKQLEGLANRRVILAFDGDDAGRKGTLVWHAALRKVGAQVEIASLPDGADLASLSAPDRVVRGSRPVLALPERVREEGDAYIRPGDKVNTVLSNWRLDLRRELHGEEGTAYEGILRPGGEEVVMPSAVFASANKLHAWASEHGRTWTGTDNDARTLLTYFQAHGPFLAQGRMTTKIGLYGGQFIWPGGQTGEDHWQYVPPANAVPDLEQRVTLGGEPDPVLPALLRDLHTPAVMDPILAWLAAAPLRALMREFPVLAVTGSAGYGKTTLLETVLPLFSGALIATNLTGTTRFALESYLTASNAFPVWVDEYRPGARKDTLQELQQLLRDAYTAQSSTKGGMQERWSALTSLVPAGPILVSGEDAFIEKSHVERMVLVSLPRDGRNPEALAEATRRLRRGNGFALGYLHWLLTEDPEGLPARITTPAPWGPDSLPPRMRTNLGILRWGWNLLGNYMRDQGALWPAEPDLSLVVGEASEAANEDPIREAIRLALEGTDPASWDTAIDRDGEVYVRTQMLVNYAERLGLPLPGGAKAIAKYLIGIGGRATKTTAFGGGQVRVVALPRSVID